MIIWIASYPKSGNTWVRMFLKSYFQEPNEQFKLSNSNLDSFNIPVFPQEKLLDQFKINYFKFEEIAKNWENMQNYINLNNKTNFLKTHSSMCTVGPHKFTTHQNTKGAIYLVRDPRDVLVSYSHHLGLEHEKTFDILSSELSFEYPTSKSHKGKEYKYSLIGSWSDHYNSWKTYKSCEVLIVKYEEMLSDPISTFSKILEYLNKIDDIKIDSEKFKKSLKQTEFKELQKMEKIQGFDEKGMSDLFFRNGKSGNWKMDLNKNLSEKIEKKFFYEMRELGYLK